MLYIKNHALVITEVKWWDGGSETEETSFDEAKAGDILYENNFSMIKVDKVSSERNS